MIFVCNNFLYLLHGTATTGEEAIIGTPTTGNRSIIGGGGGGGGGGNVEQQPDGSGRLQQKKRQSVSRKLSYNEERVFELFGDFEVADRCEAGFYILSQLPFHNHESDVVGSLLARWRLVMLRMVVESYQKWLLPEDRIQRMEWQRMILVEADRSTTDGKKIHAHPLARESEYIQNQVEDYLQFLCHAARWFNKRNSNSDSYSRYEKLFVLFFIIFKKKLANDNLILFFYRLSLLFPIHSGCRCRDNSGRGSGGQEANATFTTAA